MSKSLSPLATTTTHTELVGCHAASVGALALRAGMVLQRTNRASIPAAQSIPTAAADRDQLAALSGDRKAEAAAPRRRGRKPRPASILSPSEERLLALLDRPRRGTELPALLGVSRERVNQLIAALTARDLVRSAEPSRRTSVVARKNDPSILLTLDQERVLSRFPDHEATTLSMVLHVISMHAATIAATVAGLRQAGLIEMVSAEKNRDLYRLTAAGAAHWQRSATAQRADTPPPPALPFRSDRVRDVLAYVDRHEPVRMRDIALGLGLPQPSLNALMQYLKRKGAIRNQNDARQAPYVLTAQGRRMAEAMQRNTLQRTTS